MANSLAVSTFFIFLFSLPQGLLFIFLFSFPPGGSANINEIMKFSAGGEGLRVAKPAPTPPAPPTLARFHPADIVGDFPCGRFRMSPCGPLAPDGWYLLFSLLTFLFSFPQGLGRKRNERNEIMKWLSEGSRLPLFTFGFAESASVRQRKRAFFALTYPQTSLLTFHFRKDCFSLFSFHSHRVRYLRFSLLTFLFSLPCGGVRGAGQPYLTAGERAQRA